MSKFVSILTASIIALALCGPSTTAAETDTGLRGTSKKVSYSELDLDKKEGAIVLYERLKIAARQVCSVRTYTVKGSLREAATRKACYRETLDAAVSQVNNVHVNKLHAG
jgi:UrcA family protein